MLRYFLIEEYRRHLAMARKYSFFVFPLYIVFFTAVGSIFIEDVMRIFPYRDFIMLTLITTFIYGFGVGSFEFLGRSLEGFTLVNTSSVLPISTRRTYFYAYLRDAIYYTLLFLLPMYGGLLLSMPFSGMSPVQVSVFSLSVLISMFLGYSSSYLSFALYHRNRTSYFLFLLLVFLYLILAYLGAIPYPVAEFQYTRDAVHLLYSIVAITALFTLAYAMTPEEFRSDTRERRNLLRTSHSKFRDILLAKEMVDVVRGGIILKSTLTYFLPMILLFIFVRVLSEAASRGIYTPLSLTVMLSIFSTVVYSWLTIMDDYRYLAYLPLSPWDLIKTHMKVHVLIVSLISVPIIFYLNWNAPAGLAPSFALFYLNVFYLLAVTANLAGYRVTSMLFDPEVVMKFSLYSVVPGIVLTISSIDLGGISIAVIAVTSSLMVLFGLHSLRKAKKKWVYYD